MNKRINGTSAVADAFARGACWNICKSRGSDQIVEYAVSAKGGADADAPAVMTRIIRGLLDGRHVGVVAEGQGGHTELLSALDGVWQDGRVLKRAGGSAFVALSERFGDVGKEELQPYIEAATCFRFAGFPSDVPPDAAFRSLMEDSGHAEIELSCGGRAGRDLRIRLDAARLDECEVLNAVHDAVADCGRYLQVEL